MEFKLTQECVGKKFVRRDGEIVTVEKWDGTDMPAKCSDGSWHYEDGRISNYNENEQDIVSLFKGPIKLEAGKFYRNSVGNKCFVGFKNPVERENGDHCFVGVDNLGAVCFWRENGTAVVDSNLVAEWVEPKRIKGWVNVYRHPWGDGYAPSYSYATKHEADAKAHPDRLACIEIDILEGEGLDGGGQ